MHSLSCSRCEEVKPKAAICTHNESQKLNVIRLQEVMGRPMSHVDDRGIDNPEGIDVSGVDYEQLMKDLTDQGLGSIAPITSVQGDSYE